MPSLPLTREARAGASSGKEGLWPKSVREKQFARSFDSESLCATIKASGYILERCHIPIASLTSTRFKAENSAHYVASSNLFMRRPHGCGPRGFACAAGRERSPEPDRVQQRGRPAGQANVLGPRAGRIRPGMGVYASDSLDRLAQLHRAGLQLRDADDALHSAGASASARPDDRANQRDASARSYDWRRCVTLNHAAQQPIDRVVGQDGAGGFRSPIRPALNHRRSRYINCP